MDWTPAIEAAQAEHDARCPHQPCDWRYCERAPSVPEMARRMGLIETVTTLADRDAATAVPVGDPALDATFCTCGHKRRAHSVDEQRCFASPCPCSFEGGWRLAGHPETWVQRGTVLSLNPEATGQAFGDAVERPDWFRHGD